MDRLRLFQTVELPDFVQARFNSNFDVVRLSGDDWLANIASADCMSALLCSITDARLDGDVVRSLPASLKAIATYSVGLDHIDLAAAREKGIAVFNTPGVLEHAVADAAMFLILGAARRGNEALALIHDGRWKGWSPDQLIGCELAGRRLGILGMGGIGTKVAERALGFGMDVVYTNRRPVLRGGPSATFVADADEMVAQSDVLLLACPSTSATTGFLDHRRLARAKRDLIVVNIGRGDLVDDEALIEALETRRIFAAGLDVFNNEPRIDPRYRMLPNAFLTPHIGSSTCEARLRMAQILVDGLKAWACGSAAPNRVV